MYQIFDNGISIILSDVDRNFKDHHKVKYPFAADQHFSQFQAEHPGENLHFVAKDVGAMWHDFQQDFKVVEAAGGLVINEKAELLCIFRNGFWDLPKGKIEKGESTEGAALREVTEECGIDELLLKDFFQTTYHVYPEKNKRVLKVSHWYLMEGKGEDLSPQVEEGITEVGWKKKSQLAKIGALSYDNIRLLFDRLIALKHLE